MEEGVSGSAFSAEKVVAAGRTPQSMQFPSPVYFARWINASHAIIGAGGGGRRFGMANLLAIVAIDTTPPTAAGGVDAERKPHSKPHSHPNDVWEGTLWRFVSAVDLEGDIPWCASAFVPCSDAASFAAGVVGHLAVSHVTCFTLVEVRRHGVSGGGWSIHRAACVPLPSDSKNPDKKPIALVQGVAVVAHDENGVRVYSMRALLSSQADGAAVRAEVEPLAEWSLPARVNDLDANRFFVPRREPMRGEACPRRMYSNYLLIAAAVQDRTLRLAMMKLGGEDVKGGKATHPILESCVVTGKDCRIPFSLMKSSMRLVQVFGVENVSPDAADAEWRKVRHLHRTEGVRGSMTVARLVVVVYDVTGNLSYLLTARVTTTATTSNAAATDIVSISQPRQEVSTESEQPKPRRQLSLQLHFSPQPSTITKDGVTSLSPCYYSRAGPETSASEGVGTSVPTQWLVGTVEGSILSVEYCGGGVFEARSERPSTNKKMAKRFPALHREPISCVAVSTLNDVLTTDIAQNVVISVLPFSEKLSLQSSLPEKRDGEHTDGKVTHTESKVEVTPLRSKYESLSLFPPKNKSSSFLSCCVSPFSLRRLLIFALVFVPLLAITTTYWLGESHISWKVPNSTYRFNASVTNASAFRIDK